MYLKFKKDEKQEFIKDLQILRKYITEVDFDSLIMRIEKSNKAVNIFKIDTKSSKRSLQQNSYYWGAIIPFVHYMKIFPSLAKFELKQSINVKGIDMLVSEAYHGILSKMFLGYRTLDKNGKIVEGIVRSSSLSTQMFETYLLQISEFVFDTVGIYPPTPDEYEQWTWSAELNETQEDFFKQFNKTINP